jgi:diguanylate cyclase
LFIDRLLLSCGEGNLFCLGRAQFCWKAASADTEAIDSSVEAVARLFNAPFSIAGRLIRATVSFGIAKGDYADPAMLSNKATSAAKRAGEMGARSMWYDDGLAHDSDQSLFILSEFEDALIKGQISIAYQPKYCFAESRATGAEALVRWHHPERGTITPAIFIPVLERENLLEPLTLFALRQAIEDVQQWNVVGPPIGCAVNISASLLSNAEFLRRAEELIIESKVDPGLLTFELTETAVLASLERAASAFDRFKELGVSVSIDDYGSGQSTLSYLKNFAADEIKIDQSLIMMIASDNMHRIMVRSSIEMAHALDMNVVAEGVEDAETMEVLRELGCDVIQGWHIGKAVPHFDFIRNWKDSWIFESNELWSDRQVLRA